MSNLRRAWLMAWLLVLGAMSTQAAAARPAHPALWVIRDADTTIYLFGTVHLLPDDTHWRFPALDKALADSRALYIEVTDANVATLQPLVLKLGLDMAHPLSTYLTNAEQATLEQAANTADIPGGSAALNMMRPWLAAVTLSVAPLRKAGMDPERGVDKLLHAQFTAVHKPVHGLETAAEQLHFLADLPHAVQLQFLRSTLRDFAHAEHDLRQLIDAWQNGDVAHIAQLQDSQLRQPSPELYQRLLVTRNQAWAQRVAHILQQPGTVFIAVGAAHLAGPDSLQAQLRKAGIPTRRLDAATTPAHKATVPGR